MDYETFDIALDLQHNQQFMVDFQQQGVAPLLMDEPPPLGQGQGPNAARLLAAAVGNCLSASALFCLRKARVDVRGMRTRVTATLQRHELQRMRIKALNATLQVDVAEQDQPRMTRLPRAVRGLLHRHTECQTGHRRDRPGRAAGFDSRPNT